MRGFWQQDLDGDRRADGRSDDLVKATQSRADVEDFGLQRLPACERQKLPGEGRRAPGRIRDRLSVAQSPFIIEGWPQQEIRRSADHGQQIIEVMGDAPGQAADRLHLLRLDQRFA